MPSATSKVMTKQNVNTGGELYSGTLTFTSGGLATQAIDVARLRAAKAWQASGTFGSGGSVQIEGSLDGSNWTIIGSALVAAGLVNFNFVGRFVRFNCTAGDGTTSVTLILLGLSERGI